MTGSPGRSSFAEGSELPDAGTQHRPSEEPDARWLAAFLLSHRGKSFSLEAGEPPDPDLPNGLAGSAAEIVDEVTRRVQPDGSVAGPAGSDPHSAS